MYTRTHAVPARFWLCLRARACARACAVVFCCAMLRCVRGGRWCTTAALQEKVALALSIGTVTRITVTKTSANSAPVVVEVSIPAQVTAADVDLLIKKLESRVIAPLEPDYVVSTAMYAPGLPPRVDVPSSAPTIPPRADVPTSAPVLPPRSDAALPAVSASPTFGLDIVVIPAPLLQCTDRSPDCMQWAGRGDCLGAAQAYMELYCRKSCTTACASQDVVPTPLPSAAITGCADQDKVNCPAWQRLGLCGGDTAALVGLACQLSCGLCGGQPVWTTAAPSYAPFMPWATPSPVIPWITQTAAPAYMPQTALPAVWTPWVTDPPHTVPPTENWTPWATEQQCTVQAWQPWAVCSVSCGVGTRARLRQVDIRMTDSGVVPVCPPNYEIAACAATSCPIATLSPSEAPSKTPTLPPTVQPTDMPMLAVTAVPSAAAVCIVGDWQAWFACSISCGYGNRLRVRGINYILGNFQPGQNGCPSLTETGACSISCGDTTCQVSPWTPWTQCQCGGTATRTRLVLPESNTAGGCPSLRDSFVCPDCVRACPLSDWSQWSPCSASCNSGVQSRTRSVYRGDTTCIDTLPTLTETIACNDRPCTATCLSSPWSQWTPCSQSCGGGSKSRERYALVPSASCPRETDSNTCNESPCRTDCVMSEWSEWSVCSKSCEGGSQRRFRAMIVPPSSNGAPCGGSVEIQSCEWVMCPAPVTQTPTPTPTQQPIATPAPQALRDLLADCSQWAVQGECISNPVFMNVKCSFSCRVLPPLDPPTPGPTALPSQVPSSAPKDSAPASSMQFYMDLAGQIDDFSGETLDAIKAFLVNFWQIKSSVVNLRLWAGSVVIAVTLTGAGVNTAGLADQLITAFMAGRVRVIQGWTVRRMTVLNPASRDWMFDPESLPAPSLAPSRSPPVMSPPSSAPSLAPTIALPATTITNGLVNSDFRVIYPAPGGGAGAIPGWSAVDGARLRYDFSRQVRAHCRSLRRHRPLCMVLDTGAECDK